MSTVEYFFEIRKMLRKMVKGWFGKSAGTAYNDFIKALLLDDKKAMNLFFGFVREYNKINICRHSTALGVELDCAVKKIRSIYTTVCQCG